MDVCSICYEEERKFGDYVECENAHWLHEGCYRTWKEASGRDVLCVLGYQTPYRNKMREYVEVWKLAIRNDMRDLIEFLSAHYAELLSLLFFESIEANDDSLVFKLVKMDAIDNILHERDALGRTALHRAVISGNEHMMIRLVEAGADMNARDNEGKLPIEMKTKKRRYVTYYSGYSSGSEDYDNGCFENYEEFDRDMIVALYERGSPLGDVLSNFTLLDVMNGTFFELMLRQGADANGVHRVKVRGKEKEEPILTIAARHNCVEAVRLLLEYGADIDAVNADKNTALMVAVFNHCNDAAELLVERGANVRVKSRFGTTAYDIAVKRHNESMACLLRPFHTQFKRYDETMKQIEEQWFLVTQMKTCDVATLMKLFVKALEKNNVVVIDTILHHPNFYIHHTNEENRSWIHYAAIKKNVTLFQRLQKMGACTRTRDNFGWSAGMYMNQ